MPDSNDAALHRYTLYGPAFKANPFSVYAAMRGEGPVCPHVGSTGANKVWFVTRHAEARQVLQDHKRFVCDVRNTLTPEQDANRPPLPRLLRCVQSHLMRRDAEDHARLRAVLQPAFRPREVKRMRPHIQRIADALLDAVQHQHRMDLIEDFAFPLPFQIITGIIGFPAEDMPRLRAWIEQIIISPYPKGTPQDRMKAHEEYVAYLEQGLAAREARRRDDLLAHLAREEQKGRLSKEELFSAITVLLIAGHESTVRMIGNSMLTLLQHPVQRHRLRENPAMIKPALEELFRYDSSVERSIPRYAAADVELGGHVIRQGDTVVVIFSSAHRDEKVFTVPDTLDLDRTSVRHFGFGHGVHYCMGASLGRMELSIAIETLLRRLPNLRLAVPVESLEWVTIPAVRGVQAMPVCWD